MTAILVRSSPQGVNPERRLSATIFSMDFSHQPIKAFGELRRTKTEKNERKKTKIIMEEPKLIGVEQLSDKLWKKIIHNLGVIDRIRLGQCCKRMRQLALGPYCWDDAKSLEIRADFTAPDSPYSSCPSPPSLIGPSSSSAALLVGLPSLVRPNKPKRQPKGFRIRLQFANGRSSRIRTFLGNGDPDLAEKQLKALFNRLGPLSELTIWDCCLSDRYRSSIIPRCANSLKCLRLWNCHRWLDGSQRSPQLLFALLGLPSLRQLLFLDSSPAQPESNCRWLFSKQMARSIVAPLTEFQLTNCRLPLRSLEILLPKCGNSLRRLAIGCTFGKDQKRKDYLQIIRQFRELADLDLPPFIFHLEDKPQPDQWAQRLFQNLPQLRALGFRHFNSSALFRFIEFHLPKNVRVLRVHHNSHRVPNFAEIGLGSSFPPLYSQCPARSASLLLPGSPESQKPSAHPQKKHSIISHSSILSSSRSSDSLGCQGSPSAHSISAQPNPCRSATFCSSGPQQQPFSSSSSSACSSLSWAAWPLASSSTVPQSKRAKSFSVGPDDALSMATSSTWCTLSTAEEGADGCQNEEENGGKRLLADLARRKLTIFAIGEERQGGATGRKRGGGNGGRQQRLRRSKFAGVEVIYVSSAEAIVSQEVLGRMGSPIQSPYVYTTGQSANQNGAGGCQNNRKGMRVIRGDLVRTIPLASLGMESDWESDEETA